jgi:hypothetical protein
MGVPDRALRRHRGGVPLRAASASGRVLGICDSTVRDDQNDQVRDIMQLPERTMGWMERVVRAGKNPQKAGQDDPYETTKSRHRTIAEAPIAPGVAARRSGVRVGESRRYAPGRSTLAVSRGDGIDWACVINTRGLNITNAQRPLRPHASDQSTLEHAPPRHDTNPLSTRQRQQTRRTLWQRSGVD